MNMPNIKYKGKVRQIENGNDSDDMIMLYKDYDYFYSDTAYNKFIKSCENLVRTSRDYKIFIAHITEVLGINFCQVMPNITSDDATIEMHHGPLLTLYDYCDIVLRKLLDSNEEITTFKVADIVLQEHFDGNVQVVMATKTNHEGIHNRDIFLNVKQGIGDLNSFIKKYSAHLSSDQKYRIFKYIELCKETDSFDTGILDIDAVSKIITFD